MLKLLVLLATVTYVSAGLYSGVSTYGYDGYGYGGGHGYAAYAPSVSYHAPLATSYANTYKVAYAPPITKVIAAPAVTKIAYAAPKVYTPTLTYVSPGYSSYPSVSYYGGHGGYGLGNGYGHGLGYSGYSGYSGYGLGYDGLGHGAYGAYGGYYH